MLSVEAGAAVFGVGSEAIGFLSCYREIDRNIL